MAWTPVYHERNLLRISELAPNTKVLAEKWYQFCLDNKIDILITETIRDLETQKEYVAKGVSKTLRSWHLVGQALDFVPIVNKKTNYGLYLKEPFINCVNYAKQLGFSYGGDWKTFKDYPHLEYAYKGYGTDKVLDKPKVEKPVAVVKPKPVVKPVVKPVEKPKVEAIKFPKLVESIKNGDIGLTVKVIQTALCKHGFKVSIDGNFGDLTEKAVRQFQKKNNLSIDGIVGKKTYNALAK